MNVKKRGHDNVDNDNDKNNNIDYENRENGSYEEEEDDDDDNHDDDDDGGNKKRKKQKKKQQKKNRPSKIMSESGQTDADRRLLRRRQRELHNDIAVGAGGEEGGVSASAAAKENEEDGGGGADELTRLRTQNNELWRDVRYTREAVLDSENVDLIASKAARQAEKVVQVPRYDAGRVAQALLKKGTIRTASSSTQFNWRGLGFQVGVCFNALPSHVAFLYGPLDAEYIPKERKERAQRQKTAQGDDDDEEEQPEDVDQVGKKKESDGNELSAVQKHIKVINTTLKERESEARAAAIAESEEYVSKLDHGHDGAVIQKKKNKFVKENSHVHAVNCLFNPKSFTQTVENVFHFSFLVKDSLAGIKARSVEEAREYGGVPGPVIRPEKNRDGVKIATPTQAIVSLNMKDWRDMCKAYNVEESHVPHRVDGKVAKKEKKGRNSN